VKPPAYSYFKFVVVLGVGTVLALLLCIQCVRTYLYTDAVLVPQHAEREAERWNRRSACIGTRGRTRARVSLQTCSMDTHSRSGGKHTLSGSDPQGHVKVPSNWWERFEKHESLGALIDTTRCKAFVTLLPFRMPRPQGPLEAGANQPHRGGAYLIEVAIPVKPSKGRLTDSGRI
jgi:hypothetical protein